MKDRVELAKVIAVIGQFVAAPDDQALSMRPDLGRHHARWADANGLLLSAVSVWERSDTQALKR